MCGFPRLRNSLSRKGQGLIAPDWTPIGNHSGCGGQYNTAFFDTTRKRPDKPANNPAANTWKTQTDGWEPLHETVRHGRPTTCTSSHKTEHVREGQPCQLCARPPRAKPRISIPVRPSPPSAYQKTTRKITVASKNRRESKQKKSTQQTRHQRHHKRRAINQERRRTAAIPSSTARAPASATTKNKQKRAAHLSVRSTANPRAPGQPATCEWGARHTENDGETKKNKTN